MEDDKFNPLAKLGSFARNSYAKFKDRPKSEKEPKKPYYTTDAFWVTRWIRDFKYKRVGLTTLTWMGEEYGYRRDIERIPKSQLDEMRRSLPYPMHKSNHGWNEWVLTIDDGVTPFPVQPDNPDLQSSFYIPTAVDLHLYLVDNNLDRALTFGKKSNIPIDGKMLALVIGGLAFAVILMLGMFS